MRHKMQAEISLKSPLRIAEFYSAIVKFATSGVLYSGSDSTIRGLMVGVEAALKRTAKRYEKYSSGLAMYAQTKRNEYYKEIQRRSKRGSI